MGNLIILINLVSRQNFNLLNGRQEFVATRAFKFPCLVPEFVVRWLLLRKYLIAFWIWLSRASKILNLGLFLVQENVVVTTDEVWLVFKVSSLKHYTWLLT